MAAHPQGQLLAHGLPTLATLPVPTRYVVLAAVVVLVVSFVVLAFAWRTPRFENAPGRPFPSWLARLVDSPALRGTVVVVALAYAGWITMAALFGPHSLLNPTFGSVYAVLWVGLVPAALLFGEIYRLCNPLRWIHRGVCKVVGSDHRVGVFEYPTWLGTWPAAAGLLAFTWLELVNPDWAVDLTVLRVWFLAMAIVPLLLGTLCGDTAFSRADPFEVYSTLVARLSPFRRRPDGVLVAGNPLANLDSVRPIAGLAAVVSVLFGSTVFDSFHGTVHWLRLATRYSDHLVLLDSLSLLLFCATVYVTFCVAAVLTGRVGHLRRSDLPGQFAHSIVPIVVGYIVAHYFTFFVSQGITTLQQLGDPLGRGWHLTRFADSLSPYTIYYHPTAIWVVQVTSVVLGHLVGVIAAHNRAVALLPHRRAVVGQIPMLILMVLFTMTGLALLFSS